MLALALRHVDVADVVPRRRIAHGSPEKLESLFRLSVQDVSDGQIVLSPAVQGVAPERLTQSIDRFGIHLPCQEVKP